MKDPEGTERWQRICKMREEIKQCPGEIAYNRWNELSTVHEVLIRNRKDLLQHINKPQENRKLALDLTQHQLRTTDRVQYEIDLYRYLHNYLAAAKTLVDHSRTLAKCETEEAFVSEYNARTKTLSQTPVVKFLQELRNYVLHYRLPDLSSNLRAVNYREQIALRHDSTLERAALEQSDKWSKAARDYIKCHPRWISLKHTIEKYHEQIDTLYEWLFRQFQRIYERQLVKRDSLYTSLYRALSCNTPEDET